MSHVGVQGLQEEGGHRRQKESGYTEGKETATEGEYTEKSIYFTRNRLLEKLTNQFNNYDNFNYKTQQNKIKAAEFKM